MLGGAHRQAVAAVWSEAFGPVEAQPGPGRVEQVVVRDAQRRAVGRPPRRRRASGSSGSPSGWIVAGCGLHELDAVALVDGCERERDLGRAHQADADPDVRRNPVVDPAWARPRSPSAPCPATCAQMPRRCGRRCPRPRQRRGSSRASRRRMTDRSMTTRGQSRGAVRYSRSVHGGSSDGVMQNRGRVRRPAASCSGYSASCGDTRGGMTPFGVGVRGCR